MGLLDATNQKNYYNNAPNGYGDYQFTSLNDIINQFLVVYVGDGKVLNEASRTDVQFHAMRALQELSFDTFKSVKSQEIVLPPSLKMILPHDYVNYTKLSFVDGSGILRPLKSTRHTSNPFSILQDEEGNYEFSQDLELLTDNSFETPDGTFNTDWGRSATTGILRRGGYKNSSLRIFGGGYKIGVNNSTKSLEFTHVSQPIRGGQNIGMINTGRVLAAWHEIDTTNMDFLDISATVNAFKNLQTPYSASVPDGEVIVGVQTQQGDTSTKDAGQLTRFTQNGPVSTPLSTNLNDPDLGFMSWGTAEAGVATTKDLSVDVSRHNKVYFIITSRVKVTTVERDDTNMVIGPPTANAVLPIQYTFQNIIEEVSATSGVSTINLQDRDIATRDSSTWQSYKGSSVNSTTRDFDEQRDFDLEQGRRYGLSPEHAQDNGTFYIDDLRGFINFSSTMSGKTIVLDYISDSLGTDGEMQVHKFAEDAVYKSIVCDMMSTRINVPEYAIRRYKKDKSSSRRTAKLRLSNIKLEDITQVFRNKSKHIKH
tara:strand:- start:3402 stop:5018 length:1617 start_codon:yes stop_codon:yes gene_type:complete